MYIEYIKGGKYAAKNADTAFNLDSFEDAGYIIEENDLIIDIDDMDKNIISEMIRHFNINTQIVWTDRGAHLYFKKPSTFKRGASGISPLGFPFEIKHSGNANSITIKRNGETRRIENEGIREDLPVIFQPSKKYDILLGLGENDGRNNALFKLRGQLAGVSGWFDMLSFVNYFIFSEPLPEKELNNLQRDIDFSDKDEITEPVIAKYILEKHRVILYLDKLYFKLDDVYISDDNKLRKLIYEYVGDKKTYYIDEVIKQLLYRSPVEDEDKVYPIKFCNGILRDGVFIPVDYEEFTPFFIDIDYIKDAPPVQSVDDYMSTLCSDDAEYISFMFEVLAHTFVTNHEFKRQLAKFFIFIGDGGNGKGTLLQIIRRILGYDNCSSLSVTNMKDERYITSMKGKLANLGDDIQDEPIDREQMKLLKNISTCDVIEGRELYKQSKNVKLSCSLIFTSNHLIKSFEKGKAFKRRVVWLPMFSDIPDNKKDPDLIRKLTSKESLEYWISEIVKGYMRIYEKQQYNLPEKVSNYNEFYHQENNSAIMFLDDYTAEDIHHKKNPEVMSLYETWAEDNGIDNVGSKKMLRDAIRDRFKMDIVVKKINGNTVRVYDYI